MRGADVGPPERILALSAFCVGLYYDKSALAAAQDLIRGWSVEALQQLRDEVPRVGLKARIGGRSLHEIARDALAISRAGLAARARGDSAGRDETRYLEPLERIVAEGRAPAESWIARFEGPWRGLIDPVFDEAII
jgi:glutamate--cysteine ligase